MLSKERHQTATRPLRAVSKGKETQQEFPLPSQNAQEAPTGAETTELGISAVTALGGRVDALSGKHVAHLKEEVGFLNSALDSHIEKFGAINQEAREIIGKAVDAENEANRSLRSAEKFMSLHFRLVVFIAAALAAASETLGYFAALKFETDTGTWAHQMEKTWSPGSLCRDMGFRYERDLADNSIYYCSKAIIRNR